MFAEHEGIRFTDADVVNPDDYQRPEEVKRYGVKPWLLHDHGFALAVVFASCEQDAIDGAVDADKLDRFLIDQEDPKEMADYIHDTKEGEGWQYHSDGTVRWVDFNDSVSFLGNAGEPFDIESLGIVELPVPPFSFVALFLHRPQPKRELPDSGPPGTATKRDPLGDIFYEVGGEG